MSRRYRRNAMRFKASYLDKFARLCIRRYIFNASSQLDCSQTFARCVLSMTNIRKREKLVTKLFRGEVPDVVSAEYGRASDLSQSLVMGAYNGKIKTQELEAGLKDLIMEGPEPKPIGDIIANSRRFAELQNILQAGDDEMNIICFFYACGQYHPFKDMFEMEGTGIVWRLVSAVTGIPKAKISRLMSSDSPLFALGLVNKEPYNNNVPELSPEVMDYLSGMGQLSFINRYCRMETGPVMDLSTFNVPAASTKIAVSMAGSRDNSSILLYGTPGTGKTEYAKALAAASGKPVYFLKNAQEISKSARGDNQDRRLPLTASCKLVGDCGGLLIVDEADSILNTAQAFPLSNARLPDKAWINDFLDNSRCTVIWITNHSDNIDESTLRRFSYSLPFKPFTRHERALIWKRLAAKHKAGKFLDDKTIGRLAAAYKVNAAGIAASLQALGKVVNVRKAAGKEVIEALEELLKRHAQAAGYEYSRKLTDITDHYDEGALNTSTSTEQLYESVRGYKEMHSHESGKRHGSLNLLFWGPPGTGKTEFAKHLADKLGAELMVRRASDLLDKYVGGTEQNIKYTFEDAERSRSVLLIDEADSLFINRQSAEKSWQVSQTNELLTQMENFNGILICCTNLPDHLDKAVMRRFTWKVEFKPLTQAGRVALFNKYFSNAGNLTQADEAELAKLPLLSAGDFTAVSRRFRFAAEGSLTPAEIVAALKDEVRYKDDKIKAIGF